MLRRTYSLVFYLMQVKGLTLVEIHDFGFKGSKELVLVYKLIEALVTDILNRLPVVFTDRRSPRRLWFSLNGIDTFSKRWMGSEILKN